MAKQRKPMENDLPQLGAPVPISTTVPADTTFTQVESEFKCEVLAVTIEIPFIDGVVPAGHQDEAHRIDMGTLSRERMRKVKAMRRGYIANDIRMDGGYEVKTNRDALFCFLDHLDI